MVLSYQTTLDFNSLWDMDDKEKTEVAKTNLDTVNAAYEAGLIGRQTALRELRQTSRATGVFTNITQELIDAADDEVQPPGGEDLLGGLFGEPPPTLPAYKQEPGDMKLPGDVNEIRPDREARPVDASKARRKLV